MPDDRRITQLHLLVDRVADIEKQLAEVDERGNALRDDMVALDGATIDEADLTAALANFDEVWSALVPSECIRVLHPLLDRVVFDGKADDVAITIREVGVLTLIGNQGGN